MAQRKLLLDSCVYLRIAQSIHPLLGEEFGEDRICLYVISEFEGEYKRSQRLKTKFPWVAEEKYAQNRKQCIILSRRQRAALPQATGYFEDFAFDHDLTPSPVDLCALAHAYLAEVELVTDDEDLASLGRELEVDIWGCLELLDLMVKKKRISLEDAWVACDYMEYLPDMPRGFYEKRDAFFRSRPENSG